jgi:hypothetical protein
MSQKMDISMLIHKMIILRIRTKIVWTSVHSLLQFQCQSVPSYKEQSG